MIKKIIIIGDTDSDKNMIQNHIDDKNIQLFVFDYNKIKIDRKNHYLFKIPGEDEYKSVEEILSHEVDGIIFFIENKQGFKDDDQELLDIITRNDLPHVIFINREDLSDTNQKIHLKDVFIIPTMVREGIGVTDGVRILIKLIEESGKKQIKKFDDEKLSEKRSQFCKLSLLFHPIELENVKKSLERFGFSNITLIEIKFIDNIIKRKEVYRASSYDITLPSKMEINLITEKENIPYVIQAMENVANEDIYENIFISPIDEVIRIRTGEKGERAVD